MSRLPKFSLRNALVATALVCVACWSLVQPSLIWLLMVPILSCALVTFGARLALTASEKQRRVFWTSFCFGFLAYILAVLFVELLSAIFGGPQEFLLLPGWAYTLIHGSYNRTRSSLPGELLPFSVSLYFILAVTFSLSAALIAQILLGDKDD